MKKTIKKLICFILSATMLLSMSTVCLAAESESDINNVEVKPPETMAGVLEGSDGTRQTVVGYLVQDELPQTRSIGEKEATYRFDVNVEPRASGSTTVDDVDGGYASRVYLTIRYSTRNTPTEYLLTGVSGRWVITDGKASVRSAYVSYGCNGTFPSPVSSQSRTNVAVSNNFNISTNFSSYVTSEIWAVCGAYLTVNYIMGSSRTWSFTLNNYLFNT